MPMSLVVGRFFLLDFIFTFAKISLVATICPRENSKGEWGKTRLEDQGRWFFLRTSLGLIAAKLIFDSFSFFCNTRIWRVKSFRENQLKNKKKTLSKIYYPLVISRKKKRSRRSTRHARVCPVFFLAKSNWPGRKSNRDWDVELELNDELLALRMSEPLAGEDHLFQFELFVLAVLAATSQQDWRVKTGFKMRDV